MIELDGNYGEGGGSLVRVALALSALTGEEFAVRNIRAGREEGGLKPQHLHAINALKQLCNAETNQVEVGATELWFRPGRIQKGVYTIDIGTAGSISLLLQALILPALFAPGKVTFVITGGTCGKWQASVEYVEHVLRPLLLRFADAIQIKILKRGYFPKGGGEVRVEIMPRFRKEQYGSIGALMEDLNARVVKLQLLQQGKLEQIRGTVNASADLQEKEVGERIKNAVETTLKRYNVPITISVGYSNALSTGGEIVLWALFSKNGKMDYDNPVILGSDALLEKGKSSEEVGKEAAQKLARYIDCETVVDPHLADQLVPFMALLPGSEIRVKEIANHTLTNIYVTEKFLPVGFKIEGEKITVQLREE